MIIFLHILLFGILLVAWMYPYLVDFKHDVQYGPDYWFIRSLEEEQEMKRSMAMNSKKDCPILAAACGEEQCQWWSKLRRECGVIKSRDV